MYIKINEQTYHCSRRIVSDDEVKYLGIKTEPVIGETVELFRDDGFEMAVDHVDGFARRIYSGTTLTYTNKPEPQPEPEPEPEPEEPTTEDILLDMAADHEERLCLLELGL